MRMIFLFVNSYIRKMQKHYNSLWETPFWEIFISFAVVTSVAIILNLLYPVYNIELMFWAPIIEESFKLFLIVVFTGIFRSRGFLDRSWKCEFLILMLLTVLVSIFFSIFEHLGSYFQESLLHSVLRFAAHPTFTFLGITVALLFWKNIGKPVEGFWFGVGSAGLLHSSYNSTAVFGFTTTYQILLLLSTWLFIILPAIYSMRLWTYGPDSCKQASTIRLKT